VITEFHLMYQPIVGAAPIDGDTDTVYAATDPDTQQRATDLKDIYEELRTELLEEVNTIDLRIIRPAMDARESIQPLKKVIKKREDKKLDYERYQGRVDTTKKKSKLSERDQATLAKTERELARSSEVSLSPLDLFLSPLVLTPNHRSTPLPTTISNGCSLPSSTPLSPSSRTSSPHKSSYRTPSSRNTTRPCTNTAPNHRTPPSSPRLPQR
jgi:hypothetical protein